MKEKLLIARRIRISRKSFSKNYKRLCLKCYWTYVIQGIIQDRDEFSIVFNSKFIQSFPERAYDWCLYILNNIYRVYLIYITPKEDKTLKNMSLFIIR